MQCSQKFVKTALIGQEIGHRYFAPKWLMKAIYYNLHFKQSAIQKEGMAHNTYCSETCL